MPTVINAAQVVTDFGAYYQNHGQTENDIRTAMQETFETLNEFTIVPSDNTKLDMASAAFGEVIQSFQRLFTPKGSVSFATKSINLFNLKVDEAFYPDDLKYSWLQFMLSNNLDRTTMPFVRWFIEIYVFNQIKTDLEKVIYPAVYAAPTPGTPNAAIDTFNGIKKTINDSITAATIVPVVTGAPSATPEVWAGQVESFVAGIPEIYWENGMVIRMSRALALRYRKGRRIKYNINYAQVGDDTLNLVEDFEHVSVKGLASMSGVTKIWGTPKINAIVSFKNSEANLNTVEVEKVDRLVKVYTDFWFGLGYLDDALVFTNDQDLS